MPTGSDSVKIHFVTVGQLADWLGMTVNGVQKAETEGRLPVAQRTPGGARRWPAAELVEHFRSRGVIIPAALLALVEPSEPSEGA